MKNKIIGIITIITVFLLIGIFLMKTDTILAKGKWTITQYGPREINYSFYTIYNPDKGLIVVDGGWEEDEQYVREIVASLGNKIDAWILTHPHCDHIGAFNSIYSDLQGITIESIYTVDMPSPEICKSRAEWDDMGAYNDFLELNVPNINYVNPGNVLDICGLEFKVLSAYGDYVKKLSNHYLNDGAMMFKVKAKKESFLFCTDVGSSVSDYLLEKWKDELKSDYLQMGHHGNGGLKASFYRKVSPKIAFFDAPDWLLYDTTGKYTTPEKEALMKSIGSEIKSFNSAPNSIVLK